MRPNTGLLKFRSIITTNNSLSNFTNFPHVIKWVFVFVQMFVPIIGCKKESLNCFSWCRNANLPGIFYYLYLFVLCLSDWEAQGTCEDATIVLITTLFKTTFLILLVKATLLITDVTDNPVKASTAEISCQIAKLFTEYFLFSFN